MDNAWSIERQPRAPREPLRLLLRPTDQPAPEPTGHVLFVARATGFTILECSDEAPPPDQLLLLDDGVYRITSVRRSPFPRDRRPCFVVERASEQPGQ